MFFKRYHTDNIAGVYSRSPYGYIFMQAGNLEQSIQTLYACIATDPDNARFYGYLGYAFYLNGNINTAGQYYFETCSIDLASLDWRHQQNSELLALKQELIEGHNSRYTKRTDEEPQSETF